MHRKLNYYPVPFLSKITNGSLTSTFQIMPRSAMNLNRNVLESNVNKDILTLVPFNVSLYLARDTTDTTLVYQITKDSSPKPYAASGQPMGYIDGYWYMITNGIVYNQGINYAANRINLNASGVTNISDIKYKDETTIIERGNARFRKSKEMMSFKRLEEIAMNVFESKFEMFKDNLRGIANAKEYYPNEVFKMRNIKGNNTISFKDPFIDNLDMLKLENQVTAKSCVVDKDGRHHKIVEETKTLREWITKTNNFEISEIYTDGIADVGGGLLGSMVKDYKYSPLPRGLIYFKILYYSLVNILRDFYFLDICHIETERLRSMRYFIENVESSMITDATRIYEALLCAASNFVETNKNKDEKVLTKVDKEKLSNLREELERFRNDCNEIPEEDRNFIADISDELVDNIEDALLNYLESLEGGSEKRELYYNKSSEGNGNISKKAMMTVEKVNKPKRVDNEQYYYIKSPRRINDFRVIEMVDKLISKINSTGSAEKIPMMCSLLGYNTTKSVIKASEPGLAFRMFELYNVIHMPIDVTGEDKEVEGYESNKVMSELIPVLLKSFSDIYYNGQRATRNVIDISSYMVDDDVYTRDDSCCRNDIATSREVLGLKRTGATIDELVSKETTLNTYCNLVNTEVTLYTNKRTVNSVDSELMRFKIYIELLSDNVRKIVNLSGQEDMTDTLRSSRPWLISYIKKQDEYLRILKEYPKVTVTKLDQYLSELHQSKTTDEVEKFVIALILNVIKGFDDNISSTFSVNEGYRSGERDKSNKLMDKGTDNVDALAWASNYPDRLDFKEILSTDKYPLLSVLKGQIKQHIGPELNFAVLNDLESESIKKNTQDIHDTSITSDADTTDADHIRDLLDQIIFDIKSLMDKDRVFRTQATSAGIDVILSDILKMTTRDESSDEITHSASDRKNIYGSNNKVGYTTVKLKVNLFKLKYLIEYIRVICNIISRSTTSKCNVFCTVDKLRYSDAAKDLTGNMSLSDRFPGLMVSYDFQTNTKDFDRYLETNNNKAYPYVKAKEIVDYDLKEYVIKNANNLRVASELDDTTLNSLDANSVKTTSAILDHAKNMTRITSTLHGAVDIHTKLTNGSYEGVYMHTVYSDILNRCSDDTTGLVDDNVLREISNNPANVLGKLAGHTERVTESNYIFNLNLCRAFLNEDVPLGGNKYTTYSSKSRTTRKDVYETSKGTSLIDCGSKHLDLDICEPFYTMIKETAILNSGKSDDYQSTRLGSVFSANECSKMSPLLLILSRIVTNLTELSNIFIKINEQDLGIGDIMRTGNVSNDDLDNINIAKKYKTPESIDEFQDYFRNLENIISNPEGPDGTRVLDKLNNNIEPPVFRVIDSPTTDLATNLNRKTRKVVDFSKPQFELKGELSEKELSAVKDEEMGMGENLRNTLTNYQKNTRCGYTFTNISLSMCPDIILADTDKIKVYENNDWSESNKKSLKNYNTSVALLGSYGTYTELLKKWVADWRKGTSVNSRHDSTDKVDLKSITLEEKLIFMYNRLVIPWDMIDPAAKDSVLYSLIYRMKECNDLTLKLMEIYRSKSGVQPGVKFLNTAISALTGEYKSIIAQHIKTIPQEKRQDLGEHLASIIENIVDNGKMYHPLSMIYAYEQSLIAMVNRKGDTGAGLRELMEILNVVQGRENVSLRDYLPGINISANGNNGFNTEEKYKLMPKRFPLSFKKVARPYELEMTIKVPTLKIHDIDESIKDIRSSSRGLDGKRYTESENFKELYNKTYKEMRDRQTFGLDPTKKTANKVNEGLSRIIERNKAATAQKAEQAQVNKVNATKF